jgi:hypothetical protein
MRRSLISGVLAAICQQEDIMGKRNVRNQWEQLHVNATSIDMVVEDHGSDFFLVGRGRAIAFKRNGKGIRQAFAFIREIKAEQEGKQTE